MNHARLFKKVIFKISGAMPSKFSEKMSREIAKAISKNKSNLFLEEFLKECVGISREILEKFPLESLEEFSKEF